MFKLTKKNADSFFGHRDKRGARVVEPGMMFVAAKRYQYADIKALAKAAGVSMRKVTPKDLDGLKEKSFTNYRRIKQEYWEVDANRLFICITAKEQEAINAEYEAKWKKRYEEQSIKAGEDWFDDALRTIEFFKRDLERNKERYLEACAGESEYMGPWDYIDSAMGDMMALSNNLPLRRVARVIKDLVTSGVYDRRKKKEDKDAS